MIITWTNLSKKMGIIKYFTSESSRYAFRMVIKNDLPYLLVFALIAGLALYLACEYIEMFEQVIKD